MGLIQWFPGHMAKAKREISEYVKLVDIVIELRDARIPLSSKNPIVDDIVGKKPRLILLCKSKMADPKITKDWIEYFKKDGIYALDIDSISKYNINLIIPSIKIVLKDLIEKKQSKGLKAISFKAMVLGIPNVGKSTLINLLAKRKATKVGDRPGVTKTQTWIKVDDELLLLDTPGILWPKFEDQNVGMKIALCGSIKDEILDIEQITSYAINYIKKYYPNLLTQRYELETDIKDLSGEEIINLIGEKKNLYKHKGLVDTNRVNTMFLNDLRNIRIGAMTFERPNE